MLNKSSYFISKILPCVRSIHSWWSCHGDHDAHNDRYMGHTYKHEQCSWSRPWAFREKQVNTMGQDAFGFAWSHSQQPYPSSPMSQQIFPQNTNLGKRETARIPPKWHDKNLWHVWARFNNPCQIRAIGSQQWCYEMQPETQVPSTCNNTRLQIVIYPLSSAIQQGRRNFGKGSDINFTITKKTTTNYEQIQFYSTLPSGLCLSANNCREDIRR